MAVDARQERVGLITGGTRGIGLGIARTLAAEGWRRGFGPHDVALAFAGSDGGERGAMVIARER